MRFDDVTECPRCHAWCHDEVDGTDSGATLLLACCFCSYLVRINSAVKRTMLRSEATQADQAGFKAPEEEFRFRFGRFNGMTMSEALAQPNGKGYLVWLRDNNERLRSRIEAFLSAT